MTESVLVAEITGMGTVLVALLSLIGVIFSARANGNAKRANVNAAAARVQVENSHTTNLREEGDERHQENTVKLDSNGEKLDHVLEELGSVRRSIRRLWERSDLHGDQIHDLEITHPSRFAPGAAGRHREAPPP
ncbi:hypothetical protein [Glaciibacter flavus]|uniref:hypothetical protein n=1 Tax=Orlajensenia flava TaxID=2565934 RepID=UPI003B00DF48